ncbi:MAG: hypothetical protein R2911_41535 [Caldilineaceae bacterium]
MAYQRSLPHYHAQVLRIWAEPSAHRPAVWRFSLEDVGTGQRAGFADLDGLICHLLELMERPAAIEPEDSSFLASQELV